MNKETALQNIKHIATSKGDIRQKIAYLTKLRNETHDQDIEDECNKYLSQLSELKWQGKNMVENKDSNNQLKQMNRWAKKRQKGLSPFGNFKRNAGNVEKGVEMFNNATTFNTTGSAEGSAMGEEMELTERNWKKNVPNDIAKRFRKALNSESDTMREAIEATEALLSWIQENIEDADVGDLFDSLSDIDKEASPEDNFFEDEEYDDTNEEVFNNIISEIYDLCDNLDIWIPTESEKHYGKYRIDQIKDKFVLSIDNKGTRSTWEKIKEFDSEEDAKKHLVSIEGEEILKESKQINIAECLNNLDKEDYRDLLNLYNSTTLSINDKKYIAEKLADNDDKEVERFLNEKYSKEYRSNINKRK